MIYLRLAPYELSLLLALLCLVLVWQRRQMPWARWLIAALFCRSVEILLLHSPAGWSELCIAALLCAGAWRARGNLATFTRGNSDV